MYSASLLNLPQGQLEEKKNNCALTVFEKRYMEEKEKDVFPKL